MGVLRKPGLAAALVFCATAALAGGPDVLVLGDSQLTFGAGAAFVDHLEQQGAACGLPPAPSVGVVGVRSSTVRSWTGQTRKAKWAICGEDPKWRANAGVYGVFDTKASPYVQIGRHPAFPFCSADTSPLEAALDKDRYRPQLLILFLLGNATDRWRGNPQAAREDARALKDALPVGLPCVFMTTAPPFGAKEVARRQDAQDTFAKAARDEGLACVFVPGLTSATIAENKGNAANFRRRKSGAVKDPFHPTEAAARRFLDLQAEPLCAAMTKALSGSTILLSRSREAMPPL